jgi:glucose-6-phosphate dehydrogenase assembly protein OpcA
MRCSTVLTHCWKRVEKLTRLGVDCRIFVTREENASASIVRDAQESGITVTTSRPNLCDIFSSVAANYEIHHEQVSRCIAEKRDGCALMCCGPVSLISAAKDAATAHSAVMPIDLHEEAFQF